MCVALVSALTKNPTRSDVAMTGEITLRGRVLSVGGLKEKLLAAKQHEIKQVLVPKENFEDIAEVLKDTPLDLEITYVSTMDEVLKNALLNDPFSHPKNGKGTNGSVKIRVKKKSTVKEKK